MLTNVHVKNLALIKESEIDLTKGFNILTGETGAGKSIIIGSINYCLGAKADKDVVREGAEYALVELTFEVNDKALLKQISEREFPAPEEGQFVLQRRIGLNKSTFKVNGESVTAKQMRELASLLIDIHGQREHQSLLSEKKQKTLLDSFAGDELAKEKEKLASIYSELNELKNELDSFSMDESKREREISLARFEVNEIESAALVPGELEELEKKHKKMQNGKRIVESLSKTLSLIDGNGGVADNLGYASSELGRISDLDENISSMYTELSDTEQMVRDLIRELNDYISEFEFSDEEYQQTEDRIDTINRLSLKYGKTVEDILEYGNKRLQELEKLEDAGAYTEGLRSRITALENDYDAHATKAHELREKEAKKLTKDITRSLEELNFLKVAFEVQVNKTDNKQSDGMDEVIFAISLNPGEKLRPVSEVASGGELSRIMLALKTVLADRDNIDTLIFDEIDTGISGVTAWQVSKKMGALSRDHQLICITHLPQIAAMADTHFKIEKSEADGKTVTDINVLDMDGREREVARLLGSEHLTDAALNNARELIAEASSEKNN